MPTAMVWTLRSVLVASLAACLFSICEGGCVGPASDTVHMCRDIAMTTFSRSVFIDVNTTLLPNEVCECTVHHELTEDIEVYPIVGSFIGGCDARVRFFMVDSVTAYENRRGTDEFYQVHCTQDRLHVQRVPAKKIIQVYLDGQGYSNMCLSVQSFTRTSKIKVECTRRRSYRTTEAPPTTVRTTTTMGPTSPSRPTTTASVITTTRPTTTRQTTLKLTTKPGDTTQKKTTQKMTTQKATTADPTTTQQTTQKQTTKQQTTSQQTTVGQESTTSVTTPMSDTPMSDPTTPAIMASTASFMSKYPVVEIAAGVGAGIFILILLVVLITCCTGRKRERRSDEERLRGRESPEMTETKSEGGYAFDNMLYHETLKSDTGKSVTPTISDADTQDYQATKGLEELYASVNKTITDSTDIM